jgi:WD40 repeat protein
MDASSEGTDGFARRRRAWLAAASPDPDWLVAESCVSPALSPDGNTLAVISDRDGAPKIWLIPISQPDPGVRLDTGEDYVRAVSWSPDGEWLCLTTAPSGGERTVVRALRPDGSDARIIAGTPAGVASIGPWIPGGHVVGVAESDVADAATLTGLRGGCVFRPPARAG